ncbi:hypothetical protein ES703_85050 [subsurface metagenome]
MNFRVIAVGWLIKGNFQKAMEIFAAQQQMLGRMSMVEIAHYLRSISPRRTGFMASQVSGWNFRRRGQWGFSFFCGWKSFQFPGVFYPVFTLYGTGIFGLYGKPIRPVFAERLAWQDKSGKWISKAEVRGQKPKPILKECQEFGVKLIRENLYKAYLRSTRTG